MPSHPPGYCVHPTAFVKATSIRSSFRSDTATGADIKLFVPGGSANTTVLLELDESDVILMNLDFSVSQAVLLTDDVGTEPGSQVDYFLPQ
jgi:hypothetical protein